MIEKKIIIRYTVRAFYNTSAEAENPYATSTIEVPDNGIHPGAAGYKQIADTIFSTLCGTIREW